MPMLLMAALLTVGALSASPPNIVLFLTDDQDQMLGGSFPVRSPGAATPMPQTNELMAEQGATATNMFIHTPICCPSRSELLSGRYFHNIKRDQLPPKAHNDIICMHVNESKVNNDTFAKHLATAGYSVGMFGKYLNNVPSAVPPGFDAWLANGGGDYVAPQFNTAGLQFAGIPDGSWKGTSDNYTTAVVGNLSMAWIQKTVAAKKPFFAYIAPKAAHEPFIPAPWHLEHWDESWPKTEPRDMPNWNCSAESRADHHGSIATQPMLSSQAASVITGVFKNRWRTLMSVDDVIGAVIRQCEQLGVLDNTYFFYTSDHGFQLGQFNIPMDKRNVYDWDTRIHLLARGPGIARGSTWPQLATQVDLAPTFLEIAGVAKPATMDGHSLLPVLHGAAPSNWRDSVLIEYYFVDPNDKCMEQCKTPGGTYPKGDSWCTDLEDNSNCWGISPAGCSADCYPTESVDNNFIALRTVDESKPFGNVLYAEFQRGNEDQQAINFEKGNLNFFEYYNVSSDPWQMHNLYNGTDSRTLLALHKKLHGWFECTGDQCP